MRVLTDLRNRGVKDVFFVVCDGLKGLPEVVSNVWPQAHRANLHHSFDPQHFSAHLPQVLGRNQARCEPIHTAVNAATSKPPEKPWRDSPGRVVEYS